MASSPPPPPNPPPSLSRVASSAVPRAVFDCIQKFHAGTTTTNTTTTTNLMRGNTPHARISLNVAGGCATAVQWLLAVPRASNTVLDAKVLYSRESVAEALAAGAPGVVERATRSSSCSRDTAKDLAKAAYRNAIEVHYARRKTTTTTNDDVASAKRVLGVGATCAFVSNRPKKGEHRCFVSVWSKFGVTTRKVTLDKESGRSREEEDRVASECLVRAVVGDNERWTMGEEEEEEEEALGRFSGTDEEKSASWKEFREDALTFKDDELEFLEYAAPWFEMSNDKKKKKKSLLERWLDVGKESRSSSNSSSNSEDESRYMPERSVYSMHKGKLETIGCSAANVVLSGSFNPVHEGHQGMLEAAVTHLREKRNREKKACEEERTLSVIPAFELSISNADKGQLDTNVVVQRAKQFDSDEKNRLVLTRNAPLFTQKAKLLPNTVFVVGYDTAVRLVDPKYYDDSVDVMVRDLRMIKDAHNCSFLVCGRKDSTTGTFKTLADVTLPAGVFDVFEPLENFRKDVSSTEIRASSSARGEEEEETC